MNLILRIAKTVEGFIFEVLIQRIKNNGVKLAQRFRDTFLYACRTLLLIILFLIFACYFLIEEPRNSTIIAVVFVIKAEIIVAYLHPSKNCLL